MGYPEDVNMEPPGEFLYSLGGMDCHCERSEAISGIASSSSLLAMTTICNGVHYESHVEEPLWISHQPKKVRKELEMKVAIITLILSLVFVGSSAYSAGGNIVLNKYPDLKIGFTTANFLRALPVSLENTIKLIDFASDQGFTWIELRDPNAVLTLDACKQIAEYARGKKIEIGYALGAGLMDANFWEVFSRGLANAVVFDGPRTIRTAAPGDEFNIDPKKTAWTLKELHKAVKIANQAGNQARASGLKYVTENAFEVIRGDGLTSFGTTEYFANVNSNVLLQLDTGNFFCLGRNVAKPEDASAFLEKHASKLVYIHLKTSSKDHKPQPILSDNELDFNIVFSLMTKQKVPYVAIELAQAATVEECFDNHKKSVEYLMKNY